MFTFGELRSLLRLVWGVDNLIELIFWGLLNHGIWLKACLFEAFGLFWDLF